MPHTVVIAPDSFKGTIAADAAAAALERGWRAIRPHDEVRLMPMADGGEGTVDAFATAVPGAERIPVTVTGPEGTPVEASWVLLPPTHDAPGGTGVVELANTSGIELLGAPPRLRALDAHTRGFGEAIAAALARGVSRLVLGIGSSSSTDGGTGMLTALGARFTDAADRPIADGGRGLATVAAADLTGLPPLPPDGVTVLSDVTNPLLGPRGAAAVFGPQKGATSDDIAALDAGLARLARLIAAGPGVGGVGVGRGAGGGADAVGVGVGADDSGASGAPTLDPASAAGAGAAGGTGFGLLVWGAQLVPGSAAVAELLGLRDALTPADARRPAPPHAEASHDLPGVRAVDAKGAPRSGPARWGEQAEVVVVTGEGSYDGQSAGGKVPAHVAAVAAASGVPVALIAGRIAGDADVSAFAATASLTELAGSGDAAMAEPDRWLAEAGAALARALA